MVGSAHEGPAQSKESAELATQLFVEITRSEQHFNTLEAEYRKLASSWLLAAFGAMGYIATANNIPVPAGLTVFLISVAAALGIHLLWVVDLLTYHQLLLANFLEGLRLEKRHSHLPQVRGNMIAQGSTGKRVRLFYCGSSLIPLFFGVGAYFAINHATASMISDALVLVATALVIVACGVLLLKTPAKWSRLQIEKIQASHSTHDPQS